MKARDWLRQNTVLTTVAAVALLLAALARIVYLCRPAMDSRPALIYFYDLQRKELVTGGADKLARLDGQGGEVRAYVYACGKCAGSERDTAHVGWLEKYTDDAKAELAKIEPTQMPPASGTLGGAPDVIRKGHLVSARDPVNWVRYDSDEGVKLLNQVAGKCPPNERAILCNP